MVGKRIKEIRTVLGKTQQDFADEMEIHRESLGKIERDENAPSFNFLERLQTKYDVSIDYVISGTGKMLLSDNVERGIPQDYINVFLVLQNLEEEDKLFAWDQFKKIIKYIINKYENDKPRGK